MAENKTKPDLRFRGFTDEWEQRKVGDVAEIIAGGTPSTTHLEYWKPKQIPWLSSGEVHKKKIFSTDEMISENGIKNSSAKWIPENSVLIALAGQGKTRGTVAINRISLTTNQSIAAMIFKKDIVPEFAFSNLESRYDELRSISSADGSRGGLNKQLISDIIIPYTSKDEQTEIGGFFEYVDNLITLHQRKYEKLVNLKKSMLEKMFPQNGNAYPEIRFFGFTAPWEQRKAGRIFTTTADKGYPELPVLSATQDRGMIRRDENSINVYHDKSNEIGYKRVLSGQFVIHLRSFQGGFAHSALEGITSPAYTVLDFLEKENQYDYYWKYVLTSEDFIKRLETVTYGIRDGRSISYDDFCGLTFSFPTYEEQKQIADVLKKIDNLITLHQHKLEKLKNLKKSMLQKMFV